MSGEADDRRWSVRTAPMAGQTIRDDDQPAAPVEARSVFDPKHPRFEPGSELGRGGMGRVVEAMDRVLGRAVAIKHSLATDRVNTARFEREVRITARLQHPSIVPILDAGRGEDGQPFYVMRKIDGEPLARRVDEARTVRDRLALVPALLAAVDAAAYAHAQGIVHRDIKPWNILLGPFGESLLIDWGLARELADDVPDDAAIPASGDEALTRIGSAYGTPGFMAPEQARGEPADPRADVYSLGATLYFLLVGSVPFAGETPTVIISQVAAGAGPELARISDDVPRELVAIVGKAVATERAARYADAGELGADLRRFLGGQLVAAHRYTARERVTRWVRRHRLVTAVAAIAIAVIAIGSVISVRRVIAERDQATEATRLAETRADERLVDRARSLVATDPTSAVAALRELPASSALWPKAREVVRAAVAGGVERLVGRHDRSVVALAVAPDGRIASGGADGIQLHDPARGTTRMLATTATSQLAWLDDRMLVHAFRSSGAPSQVAILDTETGLATPIATAFQELAVGNGRVYLRGEHGDVTWFAADGTATTLAEAGVDAIDAKAGRLVMINRTRIVVIDGSGARREQPIEVAKRIFQVAISADGTRVAASIFQGTLEWTLGADSPPQHWARSGTELNGIVYAGELLCGWSSDGTGVVSFEGDRVVPRWVVPPHRILPMHRATFAAGAVFATPAGRLAYAGAFGLVELPHRAMPATTIAIDGAGTRIVFGTSDGEVLALDATAVVPTVLAIAPNTRIYSIGHEVALIGREAGTQYNGEDSPPSLVDDLAILDLKTGARRELAPIGRFVSAEVTPRVIAATSFGTFAIWDLAGTKLYEVTKAKKVSIGDAFAYHTTPAGDLVAVTLDRDVRASVLAHFDPERLASSIAPMTAVEGGVTLTLGEVTYFIDASGAHELAGIPGTPTSVLPDRAGGWWYVQDYESVWHLTREGVTRRVSIDQKVRSLRWTGGRLWARNDTTVYELAPDGRVLQATSELRAARAVAGGVLLASGSGIEIVMHVTAVRRQLRLAQEPVSALATADSRTVVALLSAGGKPVLAVWRDPVPLVATEVLAYLGTITNARLGEDSDTPLWR